MSDTAGEPRDDAPVDAPADVPAAAPAPLSDPRKIHATAEWSLDRPLLGVRFDPHQQYVVSGAQNNFVQRWSLADGARFDLAGHDSWVRALAFADDGQTLLSGGYDGRLLWRPLAADRPEPARSVQAHDGWLRAVSISPDGQRIATCGNDHLVKVWSHDDGRLLQTLAGHERHVYNVAFHPDGGSLVSADLMGVIKAWDLQSESQLREFDGAKLHSYDKTFWADMGGARGLAFSAAGRQFAVCGVTEVSNAFAGQGQPIVVLYDWERSEPVQAMKCRGKYIGVAWSVVFHPDGYLAAFCSGNSGGTFNFFLPAESEEFFQFKTPTHGYDMALAPDGLTAAVAHRDNKLRLYRLAAPA